MQVLIGVTPSESGDDAIALGSLLCRALGAQALLCHVHPAAYDYASPGHVDAEWQQYLAEESAQILVRARDRAAALGLADVRTVVAGHRSSGVGLGEVATAEGADLIVIGSAPGASNGRFQIGSTADQLLHGSTVPVALAPEYYRGMKPEGLERIVTAFQNSDESRAAATAAAELAATASLPLTVLTLLIRHRIYGSAIRHGEDLVMAQLRADTVAQHQALLADMDPAVATSAEIAVGDEVETALRRFDWSGGEVLVLASAQGGMLRRVFLGDMTYKLIRATPVPAIVLPRNT